MWNNLPQFKKKINSGSSNNDIYKTRLEIIYLIYIYV